MDSPHMTTIAAAVADALAALVCVAALAKYLPEIAAGLTIIWYLIRIASWLGGRE